jgi:signal transduction histidine kinase/ActR/RegA family two-component response regulator
VALVAAAVVAMFGAIAVWWQLDQSALDSEQAETVQLLAIFLVGAPILAFGATAAVIGARARVRRETDAAEKAALSRRLDAEHARIEHLIEQVPIGVALWEGVEHRCAALNPAYRALTEERARVGATFAELFSDDAAALAALDEVYRSGLAADIPERRVAERYVATTLRAVRDADGAITGVLAVDVDVTAQFEAKSALEESRAAADAASRAKDEFLAMLGHELRNPLAPILTALEVMRSRPDRPNERERAVIDRQTRHLLRLVDDMLDISRITRGMLEIRRERADIAELIARSIEIAAPLVEQRKHELVTEVQHNLIVDGDTARLVQVLANLITNAAKYTEQGGNIRVTAARDDRDAIITVRDTGRGIDPELIPHVFEMFVQEKQQLGRPQGGLGLGLAIVRSIVELHGGTVTASSAGPGLGSELVVRLPLAAATPSTDAPIAVRSADDSSIKPVILLVDDNADAADLLADLLRIRGCVVHVARDSAEALQAATQLVPDVALLDIGLPVMDGYELARRLRELPDWSQVRLVALTGYGNENDRKRSSEAGFERHLVKPIDIATVVQVVRDGAHDAVPVAIN